MFGLPQSTELNKPLSKKAIFDRFKPKPGERRLFDEQISRMAIAAEISQQTVAIKASADVSAIYIVSVTLKTSECDKRNIALLSKLIDQRMLFALQYADTVRFAVYRSERVLISSDRPAADCSVTLSGLDLGAVWENLIAQIAGITLDPNSGKTLDEILDADARRERLMRQIAAAEKKAMNERQPRRKWELAEEVRRLRGELGAEGRVGSYERRGELGAEGRHERDKNG